MWMCWEFGGSITIGGRPCIEFRPSSVLFCTGYCFGVVPSLWIVSAAPTSRECIVEPQATYFPMNSIETMVRWQSYTTATAWAGLAAPTHPVTDIAAVI